MKMYEGMKKEKMGGNYKKLPIGGYVCKILGTEETSAEWGDKFYIHFDIAEGEYKDFYKDKWNADTMENKKWKGNYSINIPTEKSKYPESDKRKFNNFIFAVEESNTGFTFDCEKTDKLKGKKIGIIFANKEFKKDDGTTDFYTAAYGVTDIATITSGDYAIPKDILLKKTESSFSNIGETNLETAIEEENIEELPF